MKKFENPEMNLVELSVEDVIATSMTDPGCPNKLPDEEM